MRRSFSIVILMIPTMLSALTLTLKREACVASDVRLLDVFTADGDIENPVIMPKPANTTTVSLAFLLAEANRVLGAAAFDAVGSRIVIRPAGASAAPMQSAAKEASPEVPETGSSNGDAYRTFVSDRLLDAIVPAGAKKNEYRVKFLYKLPEVAVRNGSTLAFNFGQGKMLGTQRIRVDVMSREGKRENWFETLVEVYTVRTVLTAKAYIDKNVTVTPELFEAKEFRTDRIPADSVTDAAELANRMTKYYIKRDNIVRRFHLADTIAVHKGDTVDVHAADGALSLAVKAVALADAGENMRVKLMNAATKREISGVVRKGVVYAAK